jgi:hypothetical protein
MCKLNKHFAGIVLAVLMVPAGGEVLRWVDDAGRVHYGNRAPAGSDAEVVPLRQDAAAASSAADQAGAARRERQQRLLDAYDYDRQQRALAAEQAARKQKAVGGHCRDLRIVWRQLSHPGPVYDRMPDGERAYLDDRQRRERKAGIEHEFAEFCPGTLD